MAYGEQLNLALTNYLVGRADEAYALLRSAICGIYNGPTPGGLSCHMYVDGRQRMNNEFADAISMWGRAVVEGMYGIRPKRPRGVVELSPQFPSTWSEASIKTPQFAYRWKRDRHGFSSTGNRRSRRPFDCGCRCGRSKSTRSRWMERQAPTGSIRASG